MPLAAELPPEFKLRMAALCPSGFADVASSGKWARPPHLALLERKLMELAGGRKRRLMIFMPPRHGKSEFTSQYFPAWYLGLFPDKRVLFASYEADFAESWGRKARHLLTEWGPHVFGVRVSQDSRSAKRWEIAGHRGGMQTAGVRGPLMGKGADLLIIDDPVKNAEEAGSPTYREAVWDWWRSSAYTRLEPDGAVVIIQTRWHEEDLSGKILAEAQPGEWDVISLPAVAEENDALGRAPGEPLWAARYDAKALEERRRSLGSYFWSALYQQRPAPAEGALFRKGWFKYYKRPAWGLGEKFTVDESTVLSLNEFTTFATVDLATSLKEEADYTVVSVWGVHPSGRVLLLDVVRDRFEGPDILRVIRASCDKWSCAAVWIEKVGFQLSVVQAAARAGLPVREFDPKHEGDKRTRAWAATPLFEQGRVYFPSAGACPWIEPFEAELLAFPRAPHDDQVDTVSMFAYVMRNELSTPSEPGGWLTNDRRPPWQS